MKAAKPDALRPEAPAGSALGFAAAIFLGAFLLFQVQPIIARIILPWFGGSPAVWTTCMLFFQVLLLGGYAYAHWLRQAALPRSQALIHLGLALASLALLPILPGESWKPTAASPPISSILLLTACVGAPYFLLTPEISPAIAAA